MTTISGLEIFSIDPKGELGRTWRETKSFVIVVALTFYVFYSLFRIAQKSLRWVYIKYASTSFVPFFSRVVYLEASFSFLVQVSPLQSAPAKANLMEVMVQGTHEKLVVDMLVDLGVPKKWTKISR